MKTMLIANRCVHALIAIGLITKAQRSFVISEKLFTIFEQSLNFGIELTRAQVREIFGSDRKYKFRKYLLYQYDLHTNEPEDYVIVYDKRGTLLVFLNLVEEQSSFVDSLLTVSQTLKPRGGSICAKTLA